MSDMQTDRIPKQVVDIDIVNRSMKIEHALKEMLSNPLSFESKELSEVTTQTSSRSNYDLPSISMPRHIKVGHNLNSTKTKAILKPKANPNNLKSSREYAARVQNQIDVDKNYATWVSKYEVSKNAKIDNEEVDN